MRAIVHWRSPRNVWSWMRTEDSTLIYYSRRDRPWKYKSNCPARKRIIFIRLLYDITEFHAERNNSRSDMGHIRSGLKCKLSRFGQLHQSRFRTASDSEVSSD